MTENNTIVNQEAVAEKDGKIMFASDVVATIAGIAVTDVKGIFSMSGNVVEGFSEMFGKKNHAKGVKVELNDKTVAIDLNVIVEYGCRIHEVCKEAQKAVKDTVTTMTGLDVVAVNVFVQGINIPKTEETAEETTQA